MVWLIGRAQRNKDLEHGPNPPQSDRDIDLFKITILDYDLGLESKVE
jgi:hypothetical protein